MQPVILKNSSSTGNPLEATYLPNEGMNLISYKMGKIEVIDQETYPLFHKRKAGLGALIGPHFHERSSPSLDFDTSLFPHIAPMLVQGRKDPFSHGIARYVPWKSTHSETQLCAKLSSSDTYLGTSLGTFEGQEFSMLYEARLLSTGLFIRYSITSKLPSLVGLHYYYALPKGAAYINGEVEPTYRTDSTWKPLPPSWRQGEKPHLHLPIKEPLDYGFIPRKKDENAHDYRILLTTKRYSLHLDFVTTSNKEFSYQLYRPKTASYICIEPLSARSPKEPILTTSTLEVKLQIFP